MCFKRAYDIVLRHHHSFLIRSVVSVSWTWLPTWFPTLSPIPFLTLPSSLPLISPYILHSTSIPQIAILAVPRRDDFFNRIAEGGSVEKLDMEMTKWLAAIDALVIRLSAFLKDGDYGRV
jgi:Glycolipid transfer protein (GLTP)